MEKRQEKKKLRAKEQPEEPGKALYVWLLKEQKFQYRANRTKRRILKKVSGVSLSSQQTHWQKKIAEKRVRGINRLVNRLQPEAPEACQKRQ